MGAVTVAYPRLMRAASTFASACLTEAAVDRSVALLVSTSDWEMRPLGKSSRLRSAVTCAFFAFASACASCASAASSAARSGAGSIWKSGCPSRTSEPSRYRRLSRMPATRARTSAVRIGESRPTTSRVSGTASACTRTTPTSGGAGGLGGGALPHAASPIAAAAHSASATRAALRSGKGAMKSLKSLLGQNGWSAILSNPVPAGSPRYGQGPPRVFRIVNSAWTFGHGRGLAHSRPGAEMHRDEHDEPSERDEYGKRNEDSEHDRHGGRNEHC